MKRNTEQRRTEIRHRIVFLTAACRQLMGEQNWAAGTGKKYKSLRKQLTVLQALLGEKG